MVKEAQPEDRTPEDEVQSNYELSFGALDEGSEDETDLDTASLERLSDTVVTGTDWTTETILRQLERGNIKLDPLFQRRDAWRAERKSKFIESLILGLPVPQLVLAEDKNHRGSYIVIDGKQRLLSLRQFAATKEDGDYTPLRLQNLKLRADLNGHTLAELEERSEFNNDLRAFENQPVRTVVIKGWPDENVLYLIFLRLNTGSLALSPQELRQALNPGEFVKYVDRASGESGGLHKIFKTSVPDFRMRDAELLVRYFAFTNFLTDYNGNLKTFLDLTCRNLNNAWLDRHATIEQQTANFESALNATFEIFGDENAFKKWGGNKYEGRFNRAVFDIMVYYFARAEIRKEAIEDKDRIRSAFEQLCSSNREFTRALETTTKSLEATAHRLGIWGGKLTELLKVPVTVPQLINNRMHV